MKLTNIACIFINHALVLVLYLSPIVVIASTTNVVRLLGCILAIKLLNEFVLFRLLEDYRVTGKYSYHLSRVEVSFCVGCTFIKLTCCISINGIQFELREHLTLDILQLISIRIK